MEIGTEILLKRIQDCPEEFADHDIHGIGRWTRVLNAAKECLPREEIDAIKKAMDESRRQYLLDKFNEQVLKTLAGEIDKEPEAYLTTGAVNSTFTNGVITNSTVYGQGWTDPRHGLLTGGQQQYYPTQEAEKARNAAMQQQSGSGLLSKLGFGRWF
jgi:hypothetical protein